MVVDRPAAALEAHDRVDGEAVALLGVGQVTRIDGAPTRPLWIGDDQGPAPLHAEAPDDELHRAAKLPNDRRTQGVEDCAPLRRSDRGSGRGVHLRRRRFGRGRDDQ